MAIEDDFFAAMEERHAENAPSAAAYGMDAETAERVQSYLSVLNEEQYAAVVHEGSPLLILAGAGSGKTRVITTKIAWLIAARHVDPYSILAVTFTKKAANEMHERAVALEPRAEHAQIRTFHSFGAWFLRVNAEAAGISPNFTVYDDDDMVTLISKAVVGLTRKEAARFAHKIALAKDYCLQPNDPGVDEIESDPQFRAVYEAYEKRLRETGNVDFGDLIMLPTLVLRSNEIIRRRMHQRFRVIMVDEYQDSNVAQFLFLQALSGIDEGSGTYVCVVGDDDQSIYKFRGAEVKNILNFRKIFPDTTLIRLEKNYRSTSEILTLADNVVRNNEGRLGKTLSAERGSGKKPVLAFLPNQDEEAQFCADLIEKTHELGVPYQDWAVLYRTNAQSLGFESEFLHRKIPYTVVGSLKFYEREEIKDALSYLALLANPRDELAFRRIVNKPARGIGATTQDKLVEAFRQELAAQAMTASADELAVADAEPGRSAPTELVEAEPAAQPALAEPAVAPLAPSLVQTCRTFGQSLSKKAREGVTAFVAAMDTFESLISRTAADYDKGVEDKLSVLVEAISEKSGLLEYHTSQDEVQGTQRAQNMQELANSAVLYPCTRAGLLEFLDRIELDRTLDLADEEANPDSVTLITLHNTKGLEFNRVIMTGMERGIFPRAEKIGAELEEERRLCYVGITRAKNELYLTSCASRRMYGRTEYMEVSPFLLELGAGNVKVLGHRPYGFRIDEDADSTALHGGDLGANGLSHPELSSDPLRAKYARGTRIYHDDYGYGLVTRGATSDDGEYVITVQFESGGAKRFIPKYQEHSLMVVKE
jgi:DNA helicase-2/ATP-dependent DNA helicase PcrA